MGDQGDVNSYKYKGQQLDSTDAILFPPNIAKAHFNDPPGLFACFKFRIDSTKIGLIARTPSEYYPTSIKLFIYRPDVDTLEENSELAESIGDAGAARNIDSWLFKDSNKNIQIFTWIHDSEDNSVDNEKDTTISNWNSFVLSNITTHKVVKLDSTIDKLPLHLKRFVINKNSR